MHTIKQNIDTAIPQAFIKHRQNEIGVPDIDFDDTKRHIDEASMLLNS
jgi:hypothetical protein